MPTSFSYIVLCFFTFPLLLLQSLQNPKILLLLPLPFATVTTTIILLATNHFAADIKFPGVVELTTQLLILENTLWLPLCQINKFGLNTLPSKTVAIPYTCGLPRTFSGAVAGEHSSIPWVTWNLYLLIIMNNLKDQRTNVFPQLRWEVRNCHLALHLIHLLFWVSLRHLNLLLLLISDMSHAIDDATSAMHDSYDETTSTTVPLG